MPMPPVPVPPARPELAVRRAAAAGHWFVDPVESILAWELDEERHPSQLQHDASYSASNWLNRNSRLYVWQKHLHARARHAVVDDQTSVARPYQIEPPKAVAESWELTGKLMAMFREAVHADGARFAVVAIPSPRQVYDDLWQEFVDRAGTSHGTIDRENPDRRLSRICADAEAPLLLLRPAFRKATPSRSADAVEEQVFIDGRGHFNRAGNRLAATEMHRFLAGLK